MIERPPSDLTRANALDRAIAYVAPGWGARRLAERHRHAMLSGIGQPWEGADRDRFRSKDWLTSKLHPDSALEHGLETLRERSRDLGQNDAFAAGYFAGMNDYVVGCGIMPRSTILPDPASGLTEADAERHSNELDEAFARWAPFAGVNGQSFGDLQGTLGLRWWQDGDGLLAFSDVGSADKPVPLALEVIDPERLETPPALLGDPNVRMGVQKNERGRPVSYWIRDCHPADELQACETFTEVSAERMAHVFNVQFPAQSRGIPRLAPVMTMLKDLKDFCEATLVGAQVAACFSVIVRGTPSALDAANGSATMVDAQGRRLEEISPGSINYVNSNTEIDFANPQQPTATFAPFMEQKLHEIASGLDFPFELLVRNYKGLTYAAGRLSLIGGQVVFRCAQQLLIDRALSRVWRRFVREAVSFGDGVTIDPAAYDANPWLFERAQWVTPGWPWIDPLKDAQASVLAIDNDLTSKAEVIAATGRDPVAVRRQRARERRADAAAGLVGQPAPNRQPVPVGAPDDGDDEGED